MPGGDIVRQPSNRMTLPGGGPGGAGGNPIPRRPNINTMNKMVQQGTSGGIGDLPSPNMSFDGSRQTLLEQHGRNKAAYEQSREALKNLDIIRKGLDKLSNKQDMITMDNIVDEAGKLVAQGIDPVALAGVLADAPQEGGGEALGAWVANHAANAEQAEGALRTQVAIDRHRMGVSAMHIMMAHSNAQTMMGGVSPPIGNPSQQNGLFPPAHDINPDAENPLQR